MKDFLGQKLEIGDDVVFMQINYRTLKKGKILKFTPKKVEIEYCSHPNCDENDREQFLQLPSQIVKIVPGNLR